ncbi:MAG: DUF3795 domain-containing protein [Lachnospiraceae bacterium]|nr:DUF3795 domain-containing protein [Lachnospiraceae bacterium]
MDGEFRRTDGLFSLCGLNCGLCPMQIRGDCSGCFNGSTCYQTCPLAPCSVRHGNVDYCFQCSEYPCKRYDGIDSHDSLISHRNQKIDIKKAKDMGIEAYLEEQRAKKEILSRLLKEYDDGSKDVFLCLAVNMLPLDELVSIMKAADQKTGDMNLHEKAIFIEEKLREYARRKDILLVLRKG